jgi:hypothetical protein
VADSTDTTNDARTAVRRSASSIDSHQELPMRDVHRAVSHAISGGSGWSGNASGGNSSVVIGIGPVSTQQTAQGTWNSRVSSGIPSRSTEQSCGSIWIAEIAACFSIFTDGFASESDGNRGVLMNMAGLLYGFPRETSNTRENPISTRGNPLESPRNPSDTLAICTDPPRFQQEIAPFRRTRKKIRRVSNSEAGQPLGNIRGISAPQTPVGRPSKWGGLISFAVGNRRAAASPPCGICYFQPCALSAAFDAIWSLT